MRSTATSTPASTRPSTATWKSWNASSPNTGSRRPATELREATMHYLMLVTLSMPDGGHLGGRPRSALRPARAKTTASAAKAAASARRLCDWFVIGGRWSGLLRESLPGPALPRRLRARIPGIRQGLVSVRPRRDSTSDGLNRLWQRFGGTGDHPLDAQRLRSLRRATTTPCRSTRLSTTTSLPNTMPASRPTVGRRSAHDFADLDDERSR